MNEVTTIGIDLAKNVFQVPMASMRAARWWSAKRCAASRSCGSSGLFRRALSGWRRVRRRTIGRERSQRWAMRFG
jgi:hypothetical protein